MNDAIGNAEGRKSSNTAWRLWLLNAVLVSAAALFFLATQYGTFEFFRVALFRALFPFIAVIVLVGGAGSTIFAVTKVWSERRGLNQGTTSALLIGPGIIVTLLLVFAGADRPLGQRLNYICAGHAPAAASHIRVSGYSGFLREEWLATFRVGQTNFLTMIDRAKFTPVDEFEFQRTLEKSALKTTGLYRALPPLNNALCYRRVFNNAEYQRGSVYALFDPATSTAVMVRGYHD
ncbi:MAG TPA: hypothetical protein VFV81_04095 [Verrucomicrobiae bacterium]|nr:hypothetical protein [Verrucomicrobiae bacterium]